MSSGNITFNLPMLGNELQSAVKHASLHDVLTVREAEELVQQGCTFNARNNEGNTPLAVQIERFIKEPRNQEVKEIVQYLIMNDPNFTSDDANSRIFNTFLVGLDDLIFVWNAKTSIIDLSFATYENKSEENTLYSQGFKNYLNILYLFMENEIHSNQGVAVSLHKVSKEVLKALRACLFYDKEYFSFLERFLNISIPIEALDPRASIFYSLLKDLIKWGVYKTDYYDPLRRITDLFVAKGSKLEESRPICNNRLFHYAIGNLQRAGIFSKKPYSFVSDNCSEYLNYLIDLSGGVVKIFNASNGSMENFVIIEYIGDRVINKLVKKSDYIAFLKKQESINFLSKDGLYDEIFYKSVVQPSKDLKKSNSRKRINQEYYQFIRKTCYFQIERAVELYLLLNKRDPDFNTVKNWKTSYGRLVLSRAF